MTIGQIVILVVLSVAVLASCVMAQSTRSKPREWVLSAEGSEARVQGDQRVSRGPVTTLGVTLIRRSVDINDRVHVFPEYGSKPIRVASDTIVEVMKEGGFGTFCNPVGVLPSGFRGAENVFGTMS